MSILTSSLPSNRLNIDGITVKKEKKLDQVKELLQQGAYTPSEIAKKLGLVRETVSRDYIKPLLASGEIKKIDTTFKYTMATKDVTAQDLQEELYERSEIMNTQLFTKWKKNNTAKKEHKFIVRFAKICLGEVNPKFKIHPDNITPQNWEQVVVNMVDAILEVSPNKKRLQWNDRQSIRHPIMYGLEITIPEEKGYRLRIDGEKNKPKSSHLKISREQYEHTKTILRNHEDGTKWLVKFGFKVWTFVRPSIVYTIRTDEPIFYDREIKYVELNGKVHKKTEIIEFAEQLLMLKPELADNIKIITKVQRACKLNAVHEFKTDSNFNKFIYDEEIVKHLEKYVKQRKFEKKKYLFWDDNSTDFIFETYDRIVNWSVIKDNTFFKKILSEVGFTREDFGLYFRANYGFRHFGIQMWLEETDYDYDFVQSMSHEDGTTLKQWYGKQSAEYQEKRTSEVQF